jgi:exopolysaccharide biosynthesis predicted pyruvyltransferase EpsI
MGKGKNDQLNARMYVLVFYDSFVWGYATGIWCATLLKYMNLETKVERQLLREEFFAEVFSGLKGKKIGFVKPLGNLGDELIFSATCQLFDYFKIDWQEVNLDSVSKEIEELVYGGGGSMGLESPYLENIELRKKMLATGLPITIFPQSFISPEPLPYKKVFVREKESLKFYPNAVLAPDLALGFKTTVQKRPVKKLTFVLRKDGESVFSHRTLFNDFYQYANNLEDYLNFVANYETVITDRLHVGIATLIAKRRLILLPNSYHKNRSMYETWLKDLGASFAKSIPKALFLLVKKQ